MNLTHQIVKYPGVQLKTLKALPGKYHIGVLSG